MSKTETILASYQDEVVIPETWEWVTLQEIANRINPGFPSGKHSRETVGIPHLRPMNISPTGEIDMKDVKYVQSSEYDPLIEGDVLFNNTNSPVWVGKTACIKVDTNWGYSNHMTRIRLLNPMMTNPAWVSYCLNHLFNIGFFKLNCTHHVNQASINSTYLATKVPIPLPPTAEQYRIVSRIEELFTRLDAGVDALKKAQMQLKQYRQSVLKYAFEGALLPKEDSTLAEAENIKTTLEMIQSERKAKSKNYLSPVLSERDAPYKLPAGFIWTTVGAVEIFIGSGITPKGGKSVYVDKGIPFIRSQNVYPDGLRLEDVAHITPKMHEEMSRTRVQCGDVLLNITGASIGRATFVPDNLGEANVNQHVCIIRTGSWIIPQYLSYWLNSPVLQNIIWSTNIGVTRQGLNYSQVRRLPVPFTSIEHQKKIVEEIERSLSVVKNIRETIDISLRLSHRLRQSILRQAFIGRLVSQDPHDESAAILLEKIQSQRAKHQSDKFKIETKVADAKQSRLVN